ncbi:MAG: beta-glucosidase [Cyclobacteriaceae bacterium]
MTGEIFPGLEVVFKTLNPPLEIADIVIEDQLLRAEETTRNVPLQPKIEITFTGKVNATDFSSHTKVRLGSTFPSITLTQQGDSSLSIQLDEQLIGYRKYNLEIDEKVSDNLDRHFEGLQTQFYTKLDSTLKFPEISDDELLTKVQSQTFKYFWDFGHPVSGLARERNTSNETVTSGGSGFGLMSIIVGIERGFISRQEGVERIAKIVTFLEEKADRFHGVWSHWLNGTTGKVVPFSANDDGGDLVETAFLAQGLLTARQYLSLDDAAESQIISDINTLWEEIEWDWYTQENQNVLYWHWSPNFGWEKNLKISGWNESLIVYVLAAASPAHAIEKEVYSNGWAKNGNIVNGGNTSFYGYTLPMRSDRGGPLFFSHYSFLGLDPRNLSDQYANYWEQNVNHTLINRAYCIANPKNYVGYTPQSWGLTASDGNSGYSAHSPDNDRGVITPTAALSSMPYTPNESMEAIKHFYYILGDRLWGEYGFYDSFNITENWTAQSYLAIDQGPIVVMIENHRTGLLWDLFMSAPEVQNGLTKLGFNYE